MCGTLKNPHCSMVISAEHRSNFAALHWQISPIMTNSKDGQDHKEKCLDTGRKILSQEMLLYNMKALIFIFFVMNTVYFQNNRSNVNVKMLRNFHVRDENIRIHCSQVISRVKIFKLQGQNHRVKMLVPTKRSRKYQSSSTAWLKALSRLKFQIEYYNYRITK